jgi:hypothetical protein
MANLLEQAIGCDDADQAAKIIQDVLGIESDDVRTIASRRPGRPIASSSLNRAALTKSNEIR